MPTQVSSNATAAKQTISTVLNRRHDIDADTRSLMAAMSGTPIPGSASALARRSAVAATYGSVAQTTNDGTLTFFVTCASGTHTVCRGAFCSSDMSRTSLTMPT